MAAITQEENLIRTTLYLISPALGAVGVERLLSLGVSISTAASEELAVNSASSTLARSRLYHPEHSHLFRSSRSLP